MSRSPELETLTQIVELGENGFITSITAITIDNLDITSVRC